MVNMKGIIFNLEETDQIVYKNGKTLKIRKVMLKDCIRITFCCNIRQQQFERQGIPNNDRLCIFFFKSQRILKTTKTTDIMEDELYC